MSTIHRSMGLTAAPWCDKSKCLHFNHTAEFNVHVLIQFILLLDSDLGIVAITCGANII